MSIVAPSGCAAPVCAVPVARAQLGARSVGQLISEFLPYRGTVLAPRLPTPGQNPDLGRRGRGWESVVPGAASGGESPVDGDRGAGDVAAAVAGEMGDGRGDVPGGAIVAECRDGAQE